VTDEETRSPYPRWKWLTFPGFAFFVIGLTLGSFLDGRPDTTYGAAVRVLAILGFAYVLIHLFVMNVIVAGRIKRRQHEIEQDEEYEDIIIHPDE
jgi:hypothetical protein